MSWLRYVALGDSTTEGLQDPLPDGSGFRGWADRFAELLAAQDPRVLYANLAVRGKLAGQVRDEQLPAALALRPDLASVIAGLNDTLRRACDVDVVAGHLEAIVTALRDAGADVVTCTFPDIRPINPLARTAAARLVAYNEAIREIAARHGAFLADLERHPVASDPRLWHPDRLHANPEGHRRIAGAVADAVGLPETGASWGDALPDPLLLGRRQRLSADALWAGRHLAPWLLRRLRGRSSGDGITPKRPTLAPVVPTAARGA